MNGTRLQRRVLITNPNGLHMRPSAAFVETAWRFQSKVVLSVDGKVADGKSILDLMALGAECGSEVTLEVDGPDAEQAVDVLAAILAAPPPPED